MNAANRITLTRILLVPVFMMALFVNSLLADWLCAGIFIVAAATDGVDGYIARKYNQVTNFGKLIDPLADKLLVTAALVCLVQLGKLNAWVAVLIITREFIVTSLRIVAISEGKVIAANNWGKIKTVSQIVAIVSLLFDRIYTLDLGGIYLSSILVAIAVFMTVASGIQYITSYRILFEFK